jgi:hypothetical protein
MHHAIHVLVEAAHGSPLLVAIWLLCLVMPCLWRQRATRSGYESTAGARQR